MRTCREFLFILLRENKKKEFSKRVAKRIRNLQAKFINTRSGLYEVKF